MITILIKISAIIKAKFVKKDDCYKGNILSSFSFERLIDYVSQHIENLYHELANGNIGINPKGSDDATVFTKVNPCTYCNYRSLCNFDVFYNEYTLVDSNNLRTLAWRRIIAMPINSLNDGQYEAVVTRGCSILVSAPAGSGKTKILVNRIMALIEDDGYNVDQLLVFNLY